MAEKNFPRRPGDRSDLRTGNKEPAGSRDPYHKTAYRFIDDFFTSFDMLNLSVFEDSWRYIPSVTVKNDRDKMVITAEIPGMTAGDLEVTLKSEALVITGGKENTDDPARHKLDLDPETAGFFRKTIPLPSCIDTTGIRATYKNGMLRIMLPKCTEKSDSRIRIPVNKSGKIT